MDKGDPFASVPKERIPEGQSAERPRRSLLMNDQRVEVIRFLVRNGCGGLREISRALNASTSAAKWHLDALLKAKVVAVFTFGNRAIYHPKGLVNARKAKAIAILHSHKRDIYDYVVENGPVSQDEITEALGHTQQSTSLTLIELKRAGYIKETRDKVKLYQATGKLDQLYPPARLIEGWLLRTFEADGLRPKIAYRLKNGVQIDMIHGNAWKRYRFDFMRD